MKRRTMSERAQRIVFISAGAVLVSANSAVFAFIRYLRTAWNDPGIPFSMDRPVLLMMYALVAQAVLTGVFLIVNRKLIERGGKGVVALLCVMSAVMFMTALSNPPAGSSDNFWNTLMSRGWVVHGQNPYVATPNKLSFDPLFPLTATAWRDNSVVYGPLWTAASAVPVMLFSSPMAQLDGMKALVSLSYVAAGLIVFFRIRPTAAAKAHLFLATWMLSPLAIFEIGNNAHNEGLLVLALVVFVIGLAERRPDIAVPGLAAAALIKIWPVIFAPTLISIIGAKKRRWAAGIGIAAGLTLFSFIVVGGPGRLLEMLRWHDAITLERRFSPGLFLFWRTAVSVAGDGTDTLHRVKLLVNGLFIIIAATVSILMRGKRVDPITGSQILVFSFLGMVLSWLHPWYLVATAPMTLYPSDGPYMPKAIVFLALSCFCFIAYAFGWGLLTVMSMVLAMTASCALILAKMNVTRQ